MLLTKISVENKKGLKDTWQVVIIIVMRRKRTMKTRMGNATVTRIERGGHSTPECMGGFPKTFTRKTVGDA